MNRRSWLFVIVASIIALMGLGGLAYGVKHGMIRVTTFKIHIPIG